MFCDNDTSQTIVMVVINTLSSRTAVRSRVRYLSFINLHKLKSKENNTQYLSGRVKNMSLSASKLYKTVFTLSKINIGFSIKKKRKSAMLATL